MTGGGGAVEPDNSTLKPFVLSMRYTSSDFRMFDRHSAGRGWSTSDDAMRAWRSSPQAGEKLFGDRTASAARALEGNYRIVGVLDEWDPPHFYDVNGPLQRRRAGVRAIQHRDGPQARPQRQHELLRPRDRQ
jgi:putative ABC transport system permease protein